MATGKINTKNIPYWNNLPLHKRQESLRDTARMKDPRDRMARLCSIAADYQNRVDFGQLQRELSQLRTMVEQQNVTIKARQSELDAQKAHLKWVTQERDAALAALKVIKHQLLNTLIDTSVAMTPVQSTIKITSSS